MSDSAKVRECVDAVTHYVRSTEEYRYNVVEDELDAHNALSTLYNLDPDEYKRQKARVNTDQDKRDHLRSISAYQIKLEWFVVALKKGDADVDSFESQLKELRPRAEEALMFLEGRELVSESE